MEPQTNWVGLRLDPLDTLFFRDGRPFDAATRASGGLPQPQTLAGALRTALLARSGFDFAKFARARKGDPDKLRAALEASGPATCRPIFDARFRGPWLALESSDKTVSPLLPMPETLKRAKVGGWSVAKPVASVPGWADPDRLLPLWRTPQPDPKAEPEFVTLPVLSRFLAGTLPTEVESRREFLTRDALFGFDHRVGIEVDKDTFTSADGMLYVISLLATKPKHDGKSVCLYAEIGGEVEAHFEAPLVVPFGGEGKYVQVTKADAVFPAEVKATTGSAFWYLATPTFFPPAGRPLPKPKGTLVAAASAGGMPVSGWDVARNGPRATRFAVPAGAVYFVEGDCQPEVFLNTGDKDDKDESKHLRQEGWGFALPGTWGGLT